MSERGGGGGGTEVIMLLDDVIIARGSSYPLLCSNTLKIADLKK